MVMQTQEMKAKTGMDAGWPARGLIALGFAMVMFWVVGSWQSSAQEELPAASSIAVEVPRSVKGASFVTLDLAVRATPGAGGNLGGVVRIKRAGKAVEAGRFSVAGSGGQELRYQFNITNAIRRLDSAGGQVDVEVALIDRSSGKVPSGASLSISTAQIAAR